MDARVWMKFMEITPNFSKMLYIGTCLPGLKIMGGQRKMSGLIGALTSQTFVLPVTLTGHIGCSHS